jgi:hypothetical protein
VTPFVVYTGENFDVMKRQGLQERREMGELFKEERKDKRTLQKNGKEYRNLPEIQKSAMCRKINSARIYLRGFA